MPEPAQSKPPLWTPVQDVARPVLGMSSDLVLAAIENGQLPIRAASFGRRGLKFLNSADLKAYVQTQEVPR